jgi:hypothetical protein
MEKLMQYCESRLDIQTAVTSLMENVIKRVDVNFITVKTTKE